MTEEQDPDPPRRDELTAPYRRPMRYAAPKVWEAVPQLRSMAVVSGACVVGGGVGLAVGSPAFLLLVGLGALLAVYMLLAWGGITARATWRLRRAWRQRSELRDVLAGRPQAGSEDPELAHDLFAVSVEEDGRLLTWRFRPLAIDEHPGDDEVEVPGRPRHAARTVEDRAFAVEDAARAAEQLVEAQERAARRETAAAAAAHHAVEAASRSADRAIEARSTAAALQRATGQRSRRD